MYAGPLTRLIDRHMYGGNAAERWDHKLFRQKVLSLLQPHFHVLDYGAGRGALPEMDFRDYAAQICGTDVDSSVLENPHLNEARLIDHEQIPWEERSFDLIFSSYVLEHIARPSLVFQELFRVLKPGGYFIARTPNFFHYVPLIAHYAPAALHSRIHKLRQRALSDTFPTYYHANTPRRIRTLASQAGFEVVDISLHEGRPEYLRFNALTYLVGVLYERTVNLSPCFAGLRVHMTLTLQRPLKSNTI